MDNSSKYKNKYRVDSTRLKRWDYSQTAYYFVTVCTKEREFRFGDIIDGKMILSSVGKIIRRIWEEIKCRFDNVGLDEYIIMPNHIHGIIIISSEGEAIENSGDAINEDAINRVSTRKGNKG